MVGSELNELTIGHVISYEQFDLSYKRYRDFLDNVLSSNHKDFAQHLRIFLAFFEKDTIFKPIAQQIRSHPEVDIDSWWQAVHQSTGSFVGSGNFILPDEENERLSLLYQICMAVNTDKIHLSSMAMSLFYSSRSDSWVDSFNDRILRPMVKLLNYKIDDIEKTLRKHKRREEINEQQYRQYINQSINIYGDNFGNVATGEGTIIDKRIVINNDDDLVKALKNLKPDVEEKKLDSNLKKEAYALIDDLIELVINNGDKVESAQKTGKLVKICPWLKEKLGLISIGAIGSIVADGVIQGIKFVIFGA